MSLLVIGGFIGLMLVGMPVAVALLVPSIAYLLYNGFDPVLLVHRMSNSVNSIPLMAVPMFIWVGLLANESGATERIYAFVHMVVGRFRGGLAQVNIIASLVFSGMSGAALADIGGLGKIEIKAMSDAGYDKAFAGALTATSATVGPIFPPSIPLVLIASVAELPGIDLLLGGVLPGILFTVMLSLYIVVLTFIRDLPRDESPEKLTVMQIGRRIIAALPAFGLVPLLFFGFLGGFFGVTESAVICVLYVIAMSLVYREMSIKAFVGTIVTAARDTASVLFIVAAAALFGYVLTVDGFTANLTIWFVSSVSDPLVFLLAVTAMLLVVGMFMDSTAAMLLFTPILVAPAAALGVDLVHFGLVVVITLMIGLITPPFGLSLFMVSRIANIRMVDLLRQLLPMYIPCILTLLAVIFWPELVTYVPSLMR